MLTNVDPKHPTASKIYTLNWAKGLNSGATISTSSWVVPSGLTKADDDIVTGSLATSVQVSGGIAGQQYVLRNVITTSDGETLAEDCQLTVRL